MNSRAATFLHASRRQSLAIASALCLSLCVAGCAPGAMTREPAEVSQGEAILSFAFESSASVPGRDERADLSEWAWSDDGRYFYATFENGILRRIDLEKHQVEAEITLNAAANYIALSADGRYLVAKQTTLYKIPPNTGFTLSNIPYDKFTLIGTDDVLLLDARTLAEIARRPKRGGECMLARGITFAPDGRSLWVGCSGDDGDAATQMVAMRLGVPGLEPLQVLRLGTTLPREGNEVSLIARQFLRGERAIMVADETAIPMTVEDGKPSRHYSRMISALRIVDLDAGKDLAPPIELAQGPIKYEPEKAWLWEGGSRLTMALLPKSHDVPQFADLPADPALTRVYDLAAAKPLPERDTLSDFLMVHRRKVDAKRIAQLDLVVETWSHNHAGWVLVREEDGTPQQSIRGVDQRIIDVSPDGRWVVMRHDPGTVRFYRARAASERG